jgi:hypothetical protein
MMKIEVQAMEEQVCRASQLFFRRCHQIRKNYSFNYTRTVQLLIEQIIEDDDCAICAPGGIIISGRTAMTPCNNLLTKYHWTQQVGFLMGP